MIKPFYSVISLYLLLISIFASSVALADTKYHSLKLENGLQAYLIEDHRQPIAINMVWYNIGSADEVKGKTGLAHLLEHLMFKGTDKIKPQDFSKIIAKLGGIDNAATSTDYTYYHQLINIANLDKAMAMEADRMQNLKITEKDFTTERKVVIQERMQRIDNSPWGKFYEKVLNKMYSQHPYKNLTTGSVEDLNNIKREDALNWYKNYYSPNNAKIIIVGDLTPKTFDNLINKNFANIKPSKISKKEWPIEDKYNKQKDLIVEDKQIELPIFYKIIRTPSFFSDVASNNKPNKKDIYNLIVLAQILGSSSSSYLYKDLVLEQNIANSVSTSYSAIAKSESSFNIYIQLKDNTADIDIKSILDNSIDNFINNYDDEERLLATKNTIKASRIYAKDDIASYATSLGEFLNAGGTIAEYDNFFAELNNVTITSLKQTANKYLKSNQALNTWLLPKKDK